MKKMIAALIAAATLSIVPATAAHADDALPTCQSVNEMNCTYTATQVQRPSGFFRSLNGGPFVAFEPETSILGRLARFQTGFSSLYAENQAQFFELQDLRPRVIVAETNLGLTTKNLDKAEQTIERLRARIARLSQ